MKSPFARERVFSHTGHIGDIIAFIPIFKALHGDFLLVIDGDGMLPMKGYKYDSLKPLLDSQGVASSMNAGGRSVEYDMSGWRECYRDEISLMDAQARYVNLIPRKSGHMEIKEPWIKVDADPLTKGRVIFNRTPRYRNPTFTWCSVHKHFGDRSLFIGTKEEHHEFCKVAGDVEYYQTDSCLDVAKAIQGADFFVGNQSSSFWIAAGLMKPLIQETFTPAPNSIIPYEGAWYCHDGKIPFDKL
jgi:hypothetical protein